jgi:S-methylmethionine-dependent homocysteine/selenocysteine methylase
MKTLLQQAPLILLEGAITERLRRGGEVRLHDTLVHAPLIYEDKGRAALTRIYQDYIAIAQEADIPFLCCTPTWRTNRERVAGSGFPDRINAEAVAFMKELRAAPANRGTDIRIGGMLGCKNDCYRPEEGLGTEEAALFHAWQIRQLADSGVDFLLAETLPYVPEALGIAKAMETTGVPYLLSFVINRNGFILDGTSLLDAIREIDSATSNKPLGYMVNCAYPTFLCAEKQPPELFDRLIGYQANASSLDHCDLDQAAELAAEDVSDWGDAMRKLHTRYGMRILGGCCGTNVDHLRYLANS